jgi:hypothetical protein
MPIIYPWRLISWDGVDPHTWKRDFCFSSTTVRLCMFTIPVLKSLYRSVLLINASIKLPLWLSPFFRKPEWEILVLPHGIAPSMKLWWFSSLNPTLTSLVWNLGFVSLGVSPSEGVFQSSCILAQPTKSWWHESHVERTNTIKLMHCIIVVHCTIPYASWLHHHISIISQELFNLRRV